MSERWRRPAKVIAVEDDVTGNVARVGDRWARDLEFTLDPETVARIRLGYVCINNGCFEPQEQAFPERCSLCGFPMREMQTREFERLYLGEEKLLGAGVDEEIARMVDEKEREKHAGNGKSRILLPRGV